tara:strand:+ start:36 stop:284 length:249 start_codon:yes stop_codon:yes gene_type:complete
MKTKEGSIKIDGEEIKESELTPEQNTAKAHIQTLRNKIGKLQYEIDELMPSLKYYEENLIKSVKEKSDLILNEDSIIKEAKK